MTREEAQRVLDGSASLIRGYIFDGAGPARWGWAIWGSAGGMTFLGRTRRARELLDGVISTSDMWRTP